MKHEDERKFLPSESHCEVISFPPWLKRRWDSGEGFNDTKKTVETHVLHTVCQSARCPNRGECWARRTATFMILGDVCTRNCTYCSVAHGQDNKTVDTQEPRRVAEAVRSLGIRHAVVTSVTRDDLSDGGAEQFARTILAIREMNPNVTVEVLTPDFGGSETAIRKVIKAHPDVFGHNIETVARLYPVLRGKKCSYERGLEVLKLVARYDSNIIVKSGLMLGHGETEEEVFGTLKDLSKAGCDVVAIGQYLRPSKAQRPVSRFVEPEFFELLEQFSYKLGFLYAASGPFVRSSYHAEEALKVARWKKGVKSRES